jgi:hypothetical protein
MRMIKTMIAGGAGLVALAAAAPAAAQYGYPYGYANPYGYSAYGSQYGYGVNTSVAAQQCTAAVQNRLYSRTSLAGILGSLVGVPQNTGRVLGVTRVTANNGYTRVRGIATSGRYAYNGYSPYGVGAYGALGYNTAAAADLSFKCDVDYRGYVRDVDINRRR